MSKNGPSVSVPQSDGFRNMRMFPSPQTSLHLPISYIWSIDPLRIGKIHFFFLAHLANHHSFFDLHMSLWLLFIFHSQNFTLLTVSSICCRATWRNTACTSGRSLSTCSTERRISSRAKPRRRNPSAMPAWGVGMVSLTNGHSNQTKEN